MNISHLSKAKVLAALYNGSRHQGMGFLQAKGGEMSEETAQQLLDESPDKYFDYVFGKVMKISLRNDELQTHLYNRDNGPGAAEAILAKL